MPRGILYEKAYAQETYPEPIDEEYVTPTDTDSPAPVDEEGDTGETDSNGATVVKRMTHPQCPQNQWAKTKTTTVKRYKFAGKYEADTFIRVKRLLNVKATSGADGYYYVEVVTEVEQLKATYKKAICASGSGSCTSDDPECVTN